MSGSDLARFEVSAGAVPAHVDVDVTRDVAFFRCRHCGAIWSSYHAYLQKHPGALEAAVAEHARCRS